MKKILIISLLSSVIFFNIFGNDKPIPDTFFGLHQHRVLKGKMEWAKIPFKTWRVWDTGICWANIQPEPGKWDFSMVDKAVKLAELHKVEIVLNLGLTPRWAAKYPDQEAAYGDEKITISPPADIETWKTYVKTMGERYKGKIKYWEIWNEPDHFHFYKADLESLIIMIKEASVILKKIDNTNQVILPPVTGYPALIGKMDNMLEQGAKDYIDIIGTHFYVWFPGDTPEKVLRVGEIIDNFKKKNKITDKPVWNTECGYVWKKIENPELRAGYIARLAVVQWFAGFERVIFYSYDNWFTIRMVDREKAKPVNYVGKAFEETQKWLIGSVVKDCTKLGVSNLWTARLERNGSTAYMIWHDDQNAPDDKILYTLPGEWRKPKYRTLSGEVNSIPDDYKVHIGVSPILIYEDQFFK